MGASIGSSARRYVPEIMTNEPICLLFLPFEITDRKARCIIMIETVHHRPVNPKRGVAGSTLRRVVAGPCSTKDRVWNSEGDAARHGAHVYDSATLRGSLHSNLITTTQIRSSIQMKRVSNTLVPDAFRCNS